MEQVPKNSNNNHANNAKQLASAVVNQHRRHHSSSSLPRITKSAHNSPYSKRRELVHNGSNPSPDVHSGSDNRHNKIGTQLDSSAKRFEGSLTSLNSSASSNSSNSLNTTVATSGRNTKELPRPALAKMLVTPSSDSFAEQRASFISGDKHTPPAALVDVCSWLERNHLAS